MNLVKIIKCYAITGITFAFVELFIGLIEFAIIAGNSDKFDSDCFFSHQWIWTASFFDTISSLFIATGCSFLSDFYKSDNESKNFKNFWKIVISSHLFYLMRVFTGIWAGFIVINSDKCLGFTDPDHDPQYPVSMRYFAVIHFGRLIVYIPGILAAILLGSYIQKNKSMNTRPSDRLKNLN